ncbi:hypothetical protein W97_04154 [Coniosporium apollinis CBS 100218]|uniref:Uncharacterized protein n=1 Tax=Coniosporium apollinis (strain CBS 100218) TaxID=1168221 RepID=R7YSP0_CONA1|nr:uncharacterized protein W97_04154 [Coniosporium apollinis CBS 100218]EON64920.1 hypothetical protein W97_04154 [Coniosporium apollinis CBS 100218]
MATAQGLIDGFMDEIRRLIRLARATEGEQPQIKRTSPPLMGIPIELTVSWPEDDPEEWDDFKELLVSIRQLAQDSNLVHSTWTEIDDDNDEPALWLLMGHEVWQSVRQDRLRGSRIWSVSNNLPLNSPSRTQTVVLRRAISVLPVEDERSYRTEKHFNSHRAVYQNIAWFLQASLRLNPQDTSEVLTYLCDRQLAERIDLVSSWKSPEFDVSLTLPIRAAAEALRYAVYDGYYDDLPSIVQDQKSLLNLASVHQISAVNRKVEAPDYQVTEPIFRVDGLAAMRVRDRQLCPRLRKAIRGREQADTAILACRDPSAPERKPVTVVIWTRTSREDHIESLSTIRQIWSTLVTPPPCLEAWHPDDRLVVAHEQCSSSQHPWQDRLLWKRIPQDRPVFLLTANPDRLTRRSGEVALLVELIQNTGGAWWSRGIVDLGMETGEEADREWQCVGEEGVLNQVQAQLVLGRQRALQGGYYWRSVIAMTRLLNAAQGRSSQLSQLAVIRALVKLVCEVHQITSVLICPRTSPGAETLEDDSISTSIVRQQTFLQLFVPAGIDVQLLQGKRVSAYDGSYIKLVEQKLKAMSVSGNVLLLSSSSVGQGTVTLLWQCFGTMKPYYTQ